MNMCMYKKLLTVPSIVIGYKICYIRDMRLPKRAYNKEAYWVLKQIMSNYD